VKAISEYGALASAIISYPPPASATWTRAGSRCSARAFGARPGPDVPYVV
jgi:hypothetical protein